MRKVLTIAVCLALILTLCACSGGETEESAAEIPPAFSILQNQLKLTKQTEKGNNAAFSAEEFQSFLGEELEYITVTKLPESGTLMCNGTEVLKGQTIPANELDYLKFIPEAESAYAGFTFTCDSAGYNGREFSCDMLFTVGVNAAPVAKDSSLKTVEGIQCIGNLDINEPNGDHYTVNVITYPTDGYITVGSEGQVVYTPESGFHGTDKMVYTVTDYFGEISAAATLNIEVAENESGIIFADMADNDAHYYAHRMCNDNVMVYRYENGEYYFDPETPVSKVDFLVMLMCVANLDNDITAVADSIIDDDTGLSSGLKGYISAAANKGLLSLENNKFSPTESVTLNDALYMTAAALNLPSSKANLTSAGDEILQDSLAASVNAGLIENPADASAVLTKADVAKLLCRIEDYMSENNIQN